MCLILEEGTCTLIFWSGVGKIWPMGQIQSANRFNQAHGWMATKPLDLARRGQQLWLLCGARRVRPYSSYELWAQTGLPLQQACSYVSCGCQGQVKSSDTEPVSGVQN